MRTHSNRGLVPQETRRPPEERALCSPATGSEWVCYTRQERELRATNGSAPVSNQCTSIFWLRGSDSAMRIIQSERECLTTTPAEERPPVDVEPNIRKPVSALVLEGHAYWLLSTSFGPGGYELWEAQTDGMRQVAPIQHQWGACD